MKQNFNDFSYIEHRPLRTYNRSVMFSNLYEDQGSVVAAEYANLFSAEERFEIAQMIALVRKIGPKRAKEIVTSGLTFSDDEFVGEE